MLSYTVQLPGRLPPSTPDMWKCRSQYLRPSGNSCWISFANSLGTARLGPTYWRMTFAALILPAFTREIDLHTASGALLALSVVFEGLQAPIPLSLPSADRAAVLKQWQ